MSINSLWLNYCRAEIGPYIPKNIKIDVDEFVDKVNSEHFNLRGQSAQDCKIAFLKKVAKYQLYGATVFSVTVSELLSDPTVFLFFQPSLQLLRRHSGSVVIY